MGKIEKKIKNAVDEFRKKLRKKSGLDISKIKIVDIKPISNRDVKLVAEKLLSQEKTMCKKIKSTTKIRTEFIKNLRKIATKDDYLVTLKWTIRPTLKRIDLPEKMEWGEVVPFKKENVHRESHMIFDSKRGVIKFDSFGILIPVKVDVEYVPPKEKTHHSAVTEELGKYVIKFHDWFGTTKKYHYKATVSYNNFSKYASSIVPNDVRATINFKMWCERVAWYAICTNPIALLGVGGSFPSICPGDGSSYKSDVYLSVPTDYFESGTLNVNDDNGWSVSIGFSFSKIVGVRVTPSYDTSKYATLTYPNNSGDEIAIKHVPKCGVAPPIRGVYYKKGKLDFVGKVIAAGSPNSEKGRINFYFPVYSGYIDNYIVASSWHIYYWGAFSFNMDYVRGNAIPEPTFSITSTPLTINQGETTQLKVTIRNNSSEVDLKNVQVILDSSSLGAKLDNVGGSTRNIQRIAKNSASTVTYTLQGMNSGHSTPRLDVVYYLGDPVPQEYTRKEISVDGPTIEVLGETSMGSISGKVSLSGTDTGIAGATVRASPGNKYATTSSNGYFTFSNLEPGFYTLTASCSGYQDRTVTVLVTEGNITYVDFGLQAIVQYYVGNVDTKELHTPDCQWVSQMSESNKVYFSKIEEAMDQGYNGCYYCLKQYDTG